jgi:pimeloyl-ACP methyl ester carboxylesterase
MPAIPTSDGVQIHYDIHGTGPVNLIFLHGWGGNADTWSEVVKHLDTARCRSISIDLRGHGKSSLGSGNCSWEIFARDVLAVVEHAQAREFIPVGFSLGGKLACLLAAKNPEHIPAQVLVAPVPPGAVPIDRESGLQICREAKVWHRGKEYFRAWFGPAADEKVVDACCQIIAQTPTSILESTAEMILWTSLSDEIGRLDLPVLLVTGENDPVYGMAYQQKEMLPFLGRATLSTLASGHFIPLERPIELAGLISLFCKR